MQLGKFRIEIVETGTFGLDGGAMFGVVPKNLWSKAYNPGDEQNRIPMAARALYIQYDERHILVDTGNGTKLSEKLKAIYKVDNARFSLEASLARIGVRPADITDVILTHLHFDHAGGATILKDDTPVPAFENATYYVQSEQLQWARKPTIKDRASFMPENFEPLATYGRLQTLDGAGEILPGIAVEPVFGHTKALQMVIVQSEEKRLVFPSDLMPTHAHVGIPYVMGYDNYPLTSIEEKQKYLPRMYEDRWLVCFQHDVFRQAGYIEQGPKGFTIGEPVVITEMQ